MKARHRTEHDDLRPAEPDAALAAILRAFQVGAGSADSAPTPVSVTLTRVARFTQAATTPSGHRITLDEPAEFGGGGAAPDPAEFLLAALGASLSVTLTAHAALRGLPIKGIDLAVHAEIDGRSFFAPRLWPRAGLLGAWVDLTLTASITARDARALLAESVRACPVLRSLKPRPRVVLTVQSPD